MEKPDKLAELRAHLPHAPGVYIYTNAAGKIIYVGKAKDLKKRVASYFNRTDKDTKTVKLVEQIANISTIVTNSEMEALLLEDSLVKKHQPRYNINLKDDKNYPYFKINIRDQYPRLSIVRQRQKDGALYFGPYAGSLAESLKTLNKLFALRKCRYQNLAKIKKSCLYYQLGQCLAPCINNIPNEYRQEVEAVINFLQGSPKKLQEQLTKKMQELSGAQQYEKAAELRDRLKALERIAARQNVIAPDNTARDLWYFIEDEQFLVAHVLFMQNGKITGSREFATKQHENFDEHYFWRLLVSYYQYPEELPAEIILKETPPAEIAAWLGDKGLKIKTPQSGFRAELLKIAQKNALKIIRDRHLTSFPKDIAAAGLLELQQALHLPQPPEIIVCFDISNIQGSDTVASMSVLRNGTPDKSAYRRFIIDQETPNDFAAMDEVLNRRYYKVKTGEAERPDLIVIDGGKGQLAVAVKVLAKFDLNIPVIGLAKKNEEIFLPGQMNPLILKKSAAGLNLLQQVRDEAHRFAVTFHKHRRKKRMLTSELTEIKGLGEKTTQKLLKKFGSLEKIKHSTEEELTSVVNRQQAQAIVEYFQQK